MIKTEAMFFSFHDKKIYFTYFENLNFTVVIQLFTYNIIPLKSILTKEKILVYS